MRKILQKCTAFAWKYVSMGQFLDFFWTFIKRIRKRQNDNNPEINKAQCISVLVFLNYNRL